MVCFLMETRPDKEGLKEWCGDLSFQNRFVVKYPNTSITLEGQYSLGRCRLY